MARKPGPRLDSEEELAARVRRLVTKTVQRDGLLVSERLSVNLTSGDTGAEIAALRMVFPSVRGQVESLLARAREVVGDGKEESRTEYAAQALRQGNELLAYLDKGDAGGAVQHALWMMQALWRMDFKAVEPDTISGLKSRRGSDAAREGRQADADEQRREWQAKAEAIWQRNPRLKPASVARLIDAKRWDYIRRRITKPGGHP